MEIKFNIPTRSEVISKYKEHGGSVAAIFPIHYSRALLRAFDILPVEVWGPPGVDASYRTTHLQPYICSIVHNGLSFLQTGGLDVTDVIFVPHACDSLQGLGSILIDFVIPKQPVLPIYIPRGKRASDVDFFVAELRSIYQRLKEFTGLSPSNAGLMRCIHREEGADQLLSELHNRRNHLPISDKVFYQLIRSREYLPAEEFVEFAQEALDLVSETSIEGTRIIISGIVVEPMDLLDALAEIGAQVVADDLACCGRRLYPPGKSEEPFKRMAQRILFAPPDSTRGSPIRERRDHILQLAKTSGAKGVVFYIVKFCEPELFDLPILRKELGEANLPSITMDIDISDTLSQQVLTRLGAFLEMIQ